MRTRLLTFLPFVLALALLVQPHSVQALSCIAPESINDFVKNGGVVFIGKATSNTSVGTAFENNTSVDKRKVTFDVEHAWSSEKIASPFTLYDYVPPEADADDVWGFSKTFTVGTKYVVYAKLAGDAYRADIGGCDRSHEWEGKAVTDAIAFELGGGYAPADGPVTNNSPFNTDALLAQIQSLLAIVAQLQERLSAITGGNSANNNSATVHDFKSCVVFTGTVMESYPRQCAYGGHTYVEAVGDATSPDICGSGILTRNLERGIEGKDVAGLQQFLREQGVYSFPENTGYFGLVTEEAVQRWQKQQGLIAAGTPATTGYGVVGPTTRAAIATACGLGGGGARVAPYNCKIWNDGCNTCSRTTPGGELACTLRACLWQGVPKCEMYFGDTGSGDHTPVVHSFTGPTVLDIGGTGVWKIDASDPQNGSLSYKVDWGDETAANSAFDAISTLATSGFVQNTSFTHKYTFAGTYTITITVRDEEGLQAQTKTTVKVGGSEAQAGFSVAPVSGTVPLTVTATITLPPRAAYDQVEVCGPIIIGTIAWGDGSISSPTRLGCSTQRVVTMTHTYTTPGNYTVSYTQATGVRQTQTVVVTSASDAPICTTQYDPVCGTKSGYLETYSNSCFMKADGAILFLGGVCPNDAGATGTSGTSRTCLAGESSTYGAGFYEECNLDTSTNSLSVYEPSSGFYNRGDNIQVRWSTNVQNADSGMYLTLEDAATGRRFKSVKVSRPLGQATMSINNCNAFFSDGIEANCNGLYNNIANGGTQYRIRAVIYTPGTACFGFCPAGAVTNPGTIIESYSPSFTIGG